jgi:hypothetical protein
VADHFVDAGADALGKSLVAEAGGNVAVIERVVVNQAIELGSANAGDDLRTKEVHQLCVETARSAQSITLSFVVNRNCRSGSLSTHGAWFFILVPMMALELKPPVRSWGGFEALPIVVIAARKINMDPVARSDAS